MELYESLFTVLEEVPHKTGLAYQMQGLNGTAVCFEKVGYDASRWLDLTITDDEDQT